jgi:hypothetical protein
MFKKSQISVMSIILVMYMMTSFFIYPQADDYWYAAKFFDMGFWTTQVQEYLTWNGRYVATALLSTSPLVWGSLTFYRLYPILLIILLWLSSSFMVRNVLREKLVKGEAFFIGLALTYLTIMAFPTVSQGIYWLASAYTYTLSLVFLNFALGFFWKKNKSAFDYFMTCILSILLIGCNETIMVLWLYVVGLTELLYFLKEKKIRTGTIIVLAVSLVAGIFVLVAPGNSIRAAHFEKSHQVFRTLGNSLLYSFIDPIKFITLPLLGFLLLNFKRVQELVYFEEWKKHRWLLLAFWMGIIFMSFAPSLWGMGRRPNSRTINVIVYFHLLGFFPIVCLFLKEIPKKIPQHIGIVLLVTSLNNFYLIKDFFGPLEAYQERWKVIVETDGEKIINEDQLPRSIYFGDMIRFKGNFRLFLEKKPDFFN